MRVTNHWTTRKGLSVIELLVTMGILGVLMALVVPAVQESRAAARTIDCKNRLKQVGVALQMFHDNNSNLPQFINYHLKLLPFLEQRALKDEIQVYVDENRTFELPSSLGSVPTLACPSNRVDLSQYEVSYIPNQGTTLATFYQVDWGPSNGMLIQDYNEKRPVSFRDVTDGTSNTAMFCETRPWGRTSRDPGVQFRKTNREPTNSGDLRDLCRTQLSRQRIKAHLDEFHTILNTKYYHHINTPNESPCFWDTQAIEGLASRPPSSWHQGGVNLLLVDGSLRFVSESIDQGVWSALGSRNGAETEPLF